MKMKDIFAPLAGKEGMLEELLREREAILITLKPCTDDVDEESAAGQAEDSVPAVGQAEDSVPAGEPGRIVVPEPTGYSKALVLPAKAAKSYDADIVEQMALAKLASGSQELALKFCVITLKSWYAQVEEVVLENRFEKEDTDADDVCALREGIAKLWCVFAHLATRVQKSLGNEVHEGQGTNTKEQRFAVLILDIARSCPFVGNHHSVIQARMKLEFAQYDFLQTMNSGSMAGFVEVVKSVRVQEEKVIGILASAIAMCNDAVQKSPMYRTFSLDSLQVAIETAGVADRHRPWITDSVAKLGECVAFVRSLWQPSNNIVEDHTTASILCRETNRLSRIREILLKSSENSDLGIEYGCDCGCWSIFSDKHELFEHQKICRGQAATTGEHENFAMKKVDDYCFTRASIGDGTRYNQVHLRQTLEPASMKAKRGAKKWNVPRQQCWEVEYGCDRGCSCVFATKQELLDHQGSCGDRGGVGTLKKAPVSEDAAERDERPAQLTLEE